MRMYMLRTAQLHKSIPPPFPRSLSVSLCLPSFSSSSRRHFFPQSMFSSSNHDRSESEQEKESFHQRRRYLRDFTEVHCNNNTCPTQEVAQFSGVKIDWKALVEKTSTGISNAREYQMLWRHLAYHDTLLEKLEDGAEPMDDNSDLELELEPSPAVNTETSMEAAACVKRLSTIKKRKPNLKPSTASKSKGPMLTAVRLAACQAVSMALNMPTMGSLSSASVVGTSQTATPAMQATPSHASSHPVATTSEASTLPAPPPEASTMPAVSSPSPGLHRSQQAPNPPEATSNPMAKPRGGSKKQSYPVKCSTGLNPIQAAAVAAGARIANPVTAAAVHIQQGGSVPPSSLPTVANPLANNHIEPQPANIHYIRTGLASPPPVYSSKAQSYIRPACQNVQGGLGKLPSTGQPPSGSTAPSSRPAQQGCLESKTASHSGTSPHGKTETRNLITTTSDACPPSAPEKKRTDLSQAPNGPLKEQVSSANLVQEEPIKDQVSSANLALKEPIKGPVLLPSLVLKEEEATILNSVQKEPIQEQLTSMNSSMSKEPIQEQAPSLNLLSKEPMQEQKTSLDSNGDKDHCNALLANISPSQ